MRLTLLFVLLGQVSTWRLVKSKNDWLHVDGQIYQAVTVTRERKNILGPFSVQNQADCELACNCARGDAR